MKVDLTPNTIERAEYGLRWAADGQGFSLHLQDVARLATITVVHALGAQQFISRDQHRAELEKLQRRIAQVLARAAAAENAKDAYTLKIQAVLHEIADAGDEVVALRLGEACGVMVHLGDEARRERGVTPAGQLDIEQGAA